MSSQKGNVNRSRSQKYQNKNVFKNNMHDTSKRTKVINGLKITNVCERCKAIIEWKIKYKKYKLLKNPSTCCKCHNKCVKEPYHTVCQPCSANLKICPKCGKEKDIVSQMDSANVSDNVARPDEEEDDEFSDDIDFDDDEDEEP